MRDERGIRRALVRYGRLGRVGWFGTIHDVPLARGDAVVVLTPLGEWPGTVLQSQAVVSQGQSAAQPPPLSGELLRRLNDEDRAACARSQEKVRQLLEGAVAELHGEPGDSVAGAPERQPSTSILGADVSLCGRCGIVEFAGRGGAALGPAAVRLATAVALERVQWMEAGAVGADGELGKIAIDEETAQPGATGGGASPGGRDDRGDSAMSVAELLRSRDAAAVGRSARGDRERLGMIGAYVQKVREPRMVREPQRPHEPAPGAARKIDAGPQRRWMIRVRPTAGGILLGQLERLAELAVRYGDGSLRLTMRQGLQMHGVALGSAAEVIRHVEALAMTTRGSCGNALRNITCCPLQPRTAAAATARQLANAIARAWLPQADWLSMVVEADEPAGANPRDSERDLAYPEGYLPHKWKIGIATAEDNCVDVLTGDIGLIVQQTRGGTAVIDCYAGGSLAYRPGVIGSEAMLAEPLGRVRLADLDAVLRGLAGIHREMTGQRSRHWRRLKYLVRRLGAEELAGMVETRAGRGGLFSPLPPGGPQPWNEHPRWMRQIDGSWTRTIAVAGGRMRFGPGGPGENWLRLCRFGKALRIGPRHSLVVEGIETSRREEVDELLAGPMAEAIDGETSGETIRDAGARTRVLACVALPTCPLAIAEAERDLPLWRRAVQGAADDAAKIARTAAQDTSSGDAGALAVAVSGCSNGCSHPLTAAIGVIAESPRRFRVFVGGDGRRMGINVGTIGGPAELGVLLRQLGGRYRAEQEEGESFSRWWERRGSAAR